MQKDYSIKSGTCSKLPSLHKQKKVPLNRLSIRKGDQYRKFLYDQKSHIHPKQHPSQISQIKAHNFLNKTMAISSPSVILNLSDCIRQQQGKRFQQNKQFCEDNIYKNSMFKGKMLNDLSSQQKQNININSMSNSRSMHLNSLTENKSFYLPDKKYSFQRSQLLNLAKWIDQKLLQFTSSKQITIDQIIDYKQHILNYGLGKIIDSVSKKCKQQGDLLKILWDNSFKIFQKVLQIVSDSIEKKQKTHLIEDNQTKNIFQMNLRFVKTQNTQLHTELNDVYEKMQKVIIWNKRLRKQKKNLTIMNRILEYRNQTYSQALQQTIDMFLKSVPQPSTLNFSKKIIAKLARQKRCKKKGFQRADVEKDFKTQAKQYVTGWLKRNGFNELEDEDIQHEIHLTNDDRLELTRIDDQNGTNQVDIYDYFKLLDIGVQATQQIATTSCQYDLDNRPKTNTRATLTDNMFKKNFETQTFSDVVWFNQANQKTSTHAGQSKIIRKGDKKKSNASRFSQKSDKIKQKSQNKKITNKQSQVRVSQTDQKNIKLNKNGIRPNGKSSNKLNSKKQEDKQNSSSKYLSNLTTQSIEDQSKDNRFYQKDFTIISQKKSEQFNFDSDEQAKLSPSERYRVSISKLNGGESKFNKNDKSKNQNDLQTHHGRDVSIKDFTDLGLPQESILLIGQNNLKKLWQALQSKKVSQAQRRDSRLSMNFIKYDNDISYSLKKLQKKSFNQVYEQGRMNSISKEKDRQELFQTVVRRRSFYKKGKIMFENAMDVQESKQMKGNLYKSYLNYKTHRNRTILELAEQQEQRVDQISKKMAIPSNLAKSKALAASKQSFKQLSQSCKKTRKQPPKNKQYFQSSLISITKSVHSLVQDYLRQIKRQKDQILNECQKTYYPLHTILMQKMNFKYGLKDISEKKLKDFIQKILTFAPVSEKITLYSLLFGMEVEGVGADELLVYLKCLIYLERKQPISSSIHIMKQTNLLMDRVNTDYQIVQQNMQKILKEFFDNQGIEIAKNEINLYLEQNPRHLSIQKIAQIIIRCLLNRKQLFKQDCTLLYKLSLRGSNIFTNLYKFLKVHNKYNSITLNAKDKQNKVSIQRSQIQISLILKEFIKRSDVIDQIYGKSISFDRFLTAYMVTGLPKYEELSRTFSGVTQMFGEKYSQLSFLTVDSNRAVKQKITKFCPQNIKLLQQIQRKWHNKPTQRPDQESWQWTVTKTVTQHIQNNMKSMLGKLGIMNNQIQNFFFSIQNKKQNEMINAKQISM